MPKIQQLRSGQLIITIPTQIARLKEWKKGMELTIIAERDGTIILKEIKK